MSVEAMATVLHHSRASGTDKLVLLGIANHMGDGGAYPSLGTLARYANVSVRSVQRSVDRLEELGEIAVKLHGGGGRDTRADRRPNRYHILVACPPGCSGGPQHRHDDSDRRDTDPVATWSESDGTTPTSPRAAHDVTPTSPRDPSRGDAGDATTRRPRHDGVTPTSGEPSLNHPEPPPWAPPSGAGRRPDDTWHALLAVCHLDDGAPTGLELGRWRRAHSDLLTAGATPDLIRRRADEYRRRWPARTMTPTAIAANWSTLSDTPGPADHPLAGRVVDRVELARGTGRTWARTDMAAEELDRHLPADPVEAAALADAFHGERNRLDQRTSA